MGAAVGISREGVFLILNVTWGTQKYAVQSNTMQCDKAY